MILAYEQFQNSGSIVLGEAEMCLMLRSNQNGAHVNIKSIVFGTMIAFLKLSFVSFLNSV